MQEKYIPKSTGRVHLFIGNSCTGKSTAICSLLYSIRKDVSKCIAYGGKDRAQEPYSNIVADTQFIPNWNDSLQAIEKLPESKSNDSDKKGIVVILDELILTQRDMVILCEIIKNPNVIVMIALLFHPLLQSVSEHVDVIYMFRSQWYVISKTFETYLRGHFKSYRDDCYLSLINLKKDRFKCGVCDKSKRDVEYVRFALIQDIKESESAQIIQKRFRGWRFRKEVLWNPHTVIGARYLELEARRHVHPK